MKKSSKNLHQQSINSEIKDLPFLNIEQELTKAIAIHGFAFVNPFS